MARKVPEWVAKHDDQKVPDRVRQRVFDAYEGICHLSGRKIDPVREPWELEHKVALILGGEHRESNLAPALKEFHKAKTAAEMKVKAKIAATRKAHLGIKPETQPIASRGFAKGGKAAKPSRWDAIFDPLPKNQLFK